ncbi:MAG: rhodanese-related sulfurtransferase [Cyanobium sp. CZS 48M]|nr:rhodanese-related sulfurtransferase [Cyanobium sp. CZS48M]
MRARIAAFYKFVTFTAAELPLWRTQLLELAADQGVKGTVLLAEEGVNGTIAGPEQGVTAVLEHLRADPRLADLEAKLSWSERPSFHRLKVRLKPEIVTLGRPEARPSEQVGTYVAPTAWDQLIDDPGTLVIDTRNAYEVALGSFEGAIDPGLECFADFPRWVDTVLRPLVAERAPLALALFCTGGIRCEKATAHLLEQGFGGVHHLQGGILRYLEQVPEPSSQWRGECFVFDQRVAVNHQLEPGEHSLCHGCRRPLSPSDRELASYVAGVSCRHCVDGLTPERRAQLVERQRQVELAERRGQAHIAQVFTS